MSSKKASKIGVTRWFPIYVKETKGGMAVSIGTRRSVAHLYGDMKAINRLQAITKLKTLLWQSLQKIL